jgi:hypothetical protein
MRRPPYTNRVMRGIYLIWAKTKINIENGHIPYTWTPQDQKDAKRALQWMGDLFDWVEWKAEQKREQEKELQRLREEGKE